MSKTIYKLKVNKLILKKEYVITDELYNEAYDYANKSKSYTSNRHDFHKGGLKNKKQKMLEGKLGEKAIKMFFEDNNINYEEDSTNFDEHDYYDFLLKNEECSLKIDVKTRTEDFHIRTLEMVEQARNNPKDIFISVRLFHETNTVILLGWFTFEDMIQKNQIENLGYLDNYVMYDEDLRSMKSFDKVLINFKK